MAMLKSDSSFIPSDFMRARRPEKFSDSHAVVESRLTRELLEYHLETLTSRKQEIEFEYFAKRLSEKEICPNLIPQTGPTGGGDSKTDTETYPVSDAMAERWYQGIGREASSERWAFAFSAKKNWRPKVQSDVKKIVDTNRDYKQVIFVTNQFVRDKVRAEIEDKLTRQYRIPVRILDRSWIIDKVFTNDRQTLAIESLHLTGFEKETHRKGPHDLIREKELRELDAEIADTGRYQGVEYQLAEDCLRSAELARGLELPRVEVDGRFARAERISEKIGHTQQRLRIAYAKAWTVFWWYNDFREFNNIYSQVESFADGSSQANDIELLVNLWNCLSATIARGQLEAKETNFTNRTEKLKSELNRLASDADRPNNALQARANRLLIDLSEAFSKHDNTAVHEVLMGFMSILKSATPLGAFPVESLEKIISELGDILPDNAFYDELFEKLVHFMEKRRSEGESGCALLNRAYQKLDAEKHYDAIRFFGRAQERLIKHEYRNQLVTALVGCGLAYEAVGLLWAARSCMLAGTSQLFAEYLEDGTLSTRTLSCIQKLTWIELQLGRIPCVLSFMELADILAGHIQLDEERSKSFEKQREIQDQVFGILLLKTPLDDLAKLTFLPQILEQRQLPHSRTALLYAMGYESILRDEGWIPQDESTESVLEFFEQWINQPANEDLPEQPVLLSEGSTELRSCILGCNIQIETACDLGSIQLAETIFGALEAFLATSAGQMELIPYRQELLLKVKPLSDVAITDPSFQIKEQDGVPIIEIRHPPFFHPTTVDARTKQKDWILKLIISVLPQFVIVRDLEYIDQLAKEDSVFSRALNFSEVSVSTSNVLGNTPKLLLSDWEKKTHTTEYPLLRTELWLAHLPKTADDNKAPIWSKLGEGAPPPEMLNDMRTAKHSEHSVVSLIDIPLWDKAKWRATAFLSSLDDRTPPLLGIGFQDEAAGKTIFEALRKRLGNIDATEELRISIITGIDRSNPFAYKVVIGSNPKKSDFKKGFLTMVARINLMEARDPKNLTSFLEGYHRAGRYYIVPAAFSTPQIPPQFFFKFAIGKTELHVRPAWLIGENDPDSCALSVDDDPIIPDRETNPPVQRALERLRSRRDNS